ncbi:MAG: DUF5060 domain-containing protein [Candidatus Zipacnadales bacterium]
MFVNSLVITGVIFDMVSATVVAQQVERWGCYEVVLQQQGEYTNPFTDVTLQGTFQHTDKSVVVEGFYDGGTTWKLRFMPDREGRWTYTTQSSDPGLDGQTGEFTVGPPSAGNHGPVRVHNTFHFAYADGTPYLPIGTTCYAWAHQGDELEQQTLETLKTAPFNKLRMCVFPKDYTYNKNEPPLYPFVGTPPREWDFTRFEPSFWQHFEQRIKDLQQLGIEADIILFHPYDRWGFAKMPPEADDRYLRYIVARLAAYRNVWWSMANEFDLMRDKSPEDWDRFFRIVQEADPYDHPRSIHNCQVWYDHTRPWVTHASIQASRFDDTVELRRKYQKPLVYDEVRYEGNVPEGWGNLTPQELVDKFWQGACSGAYVGHGETYKHDQDILWWSKGGVLHGQSPPRIAFLRTLLEKMPFSEMEPDRQLSGGNYAIAQPGHEYLIYFLSEQPTTFRLPGDRPYRVDALDAWNMTVTPLNDAEPGKFSFVPPRPMYALHLRAYREGERRRPQALALAEPTEGIAPLRVAFTGPENARCVWDFGDGTDGGGAQPLHVFDQPGLYTVRLTVTDDRGESANAFTTIVVDFPEERPLVRVGFAAGETHAVLLNGDIRRAEDGSLDLGDGEPWKWIGVGPQAEDGSLLPVADLEGLRSFTILGWLQATSLQVGSGGNRIACNLNYDRAGFDLVYLADGRLRLAVNEWPDGVKNDSSPGRLKLNEWIFFAVTYDSTKVKDNVHWYFGDAATPARLDTTTSYNRGPTDRGSVVLTLGNYSPPLHHHGLDRQFRGALRGLEIFGARTTAKGALTLEAIRERQGIR